MKPSKLTIPTITGIIGLALGLALAPIVRKPEMAMVSELTTKKPKTGDSRNPSSVAAEEGNNTAIRSRVRDRMEEQKPKEPRISIPLKTVVEILKDKDFEYTSEFDSLHYSMEKALLLLGATKKEQEDITALIKKSKSDILATEKINLRLGEVTVDTVHIDMAGMQGPAAEIASRTQDGIRNLLPADLAEGLIAAINWKEYYPADEKAYTRLEISRGRGGKLTAWEKQSDGGSGSGLDDEFRDDGTPLPAEQIFPDRWKPFLKGVMLVPKDEQ